MFFGVFFLYLLFFVVVCKSVLFLLSSILSLPYFCYPFFLILTFVIRSFGIELHLLASLIFLSVCFSFVCVCCVYVGACILYILSKDVYKRQHTHTQKPKVMINASLIAAADIDSTASHSAMTQPSCNYT